VSAVVPDRANQIYVSETSLGRLRQNLDSDNPLESFSNEYEEADARVQEYIERVRHESMAPSFPQRESEDFKGLTHDFLRSR